MTKQNKDEKFLGNTTGEHNSALFNNKPGEPNDAFRYSGVPKKDINETYWKIENQHAVEKSDMFDAYELFVKSKLNFISKKTDTIICLLMVIILMLFFKEIHNIIRMFSFLI